MKEKRHCFMTEGRRKTQIYSTLGEKIESVPHLKMIINHIYLCLYNHIWLRLCQKFYRIVWPITIKPYLKEFPSRNEVLSNVLSLPAYLLYWGIDNINFLTHIIKKWTLTSMSFLLISFVFKMQFIFNISCVQEIKK